MAIVVGPLDPAGEVSLNGRPLGPLVAGEDETRLDVTDLLEDRNELRLDLAAIATGRASPPDAPPTEVALEIAAP